MIVVQINGSDSTSVYAANSYELKPLCESSNILYNNDNANVYSITISTATYYKYLNFKQTSPESYNYKIRVTQLNSK